MLALPLLFPQSFHWLPFRKITACLQVFANLFVFLTSLLYRWDIKSQHSERLLQINFKMSLLTARVYRDTNATKTFSRYTVFCLLSRTAFEILHYLLPASCLFIITGWIMLQLASLVFYHSMSFMVKALSWHQPSNKLIWLNHDASLFTSSIYKSHICMNGKHHCWHQNVCDVLLCKARVSITVGL